VTLELRSARWKCRNEQCARKTFVGKLGSALPFARKTRRVEELVRLFGHTAGGRTGERLLTRLAIPVSDSAILRQLKRHVRERREIEPLRAIAIDDWSWRRGFAYGTIIVDLERHTVADVLASRSVRATADWLKRHPGIEVVSRDRCGLYAEGIREGAPHARQITDRFHLLQNLRENIERELTSASRHAGRSRLPAAAGDRQECVRRERRLSRQALFIRAKQMHAGGKTFVDIAAEIGIGHRTVAKWIAMDDLPHRQRLTLRPSSPLYYREFLTRRWSEGDRVGRRLFRDVCARGYVGSFSNLERLLGLGAETPDRSLPLDGKGLNRSMNPPLSIRRRDGRSHR
jgi:transposase